MACDVIDHMMSCSICHFHTHDVIPPTLVNIQHLTYVHMIQMDTLVPRHYLLDS